MSARAPDRSRAAGAPGAPAGDRSPAPRLSFRSAAGGAMLAALAGAALLEPSASCSGAAMGRALTRGAAGWLLPALLTLGAGALVGSLLGRADRLPDWGGKLAGSRLAPWIPALIAASGVGAVAGLAWSGLPVHVDGVVQAFQARVLRGGALAAPEPPLPEFFVTLNAAAGDGRWLGQFPPGFPLLLALAGPGAGTAVLHALVAALSAWATFRVGEALYGRGTGLLAAMLPALSPFALLLSASGLNHAAAAAAAACALWAAAPAGAALRPGRMLACGAALGVLITMRPLDGIVATACVAPFALAAGGRADARPAPARRTRGALALAAGLLPPLALLALYNLATTGSPLRLGYSYLWGPAHGLGFHASPWGEPHTLSDGLRNLHTDLWLLNSEALGHALPLLVAAALPLLLGPRRKEPGGEGCPAGGHSRRAAAGDATLYALLIGLAGAYLLYWHHDWFLGPRYLFTAFPAFALLVARGLALLGERTRRPTTRGALAGALAAGAISLCAFELPARMGRAFALRPEFRVDVAAEARARGIRDGVVFVKESWGSRLLARLRGRGLDAGEAERVYRTADHCALELILADRRVGRAAVLSGVAADIRRRPPPAPDPRNGDPTLRLRRGERLSPACDDQVAYDLRLPYGVYTPQLARLDPWFREGPVVARDLREEDARLVAALGRGAGWLYVPGPGGSPGAFLPLGAGGAPEF